MDISMQIRPRWGAGPASVTTDIRLESPRKNPSA